MHAEEEEQLFFSVLASHCPDRQTEPDDLIAAGERGAALAATRRSAIQKRKFRPYASPHYMRSKTVRIQAFSSC